MLNPERIRKRALSILAQPKASKKELTWFKSMEEKVKKNNIPNADWIKLDYYE